MVTDEELSKPATKGDLQNLVTKDYLDEKLEKFATQDDLKATESRLEQKMEDKLQPIRTDLQAVNGKLRVLDNKIWLTEQKFDEKLENIFRKYTDKVTTNLDKVVKELEEYRQERTAREAHDERVDKRLDRLERHVGLPLLAD